MKTSRKIMVTFASGLLCVLGSSHQAFSKSNAFVIDPPLELGETWTEENQAQTDQIIAITQQALVARTQKQEDTFIRRDAHPKHHGCVTATIKVDSSKLAPEQRVGIFSPTARTDYDAWIRFSNGSPDGALHPDYDQDIRGMAMKLMNVDGTPNGSQDFVMLTDKEFFSKDGNDYIELHDAMGSGLKTLFYFGTHLKELNILLSGRRRPANPLQVEYFSSVPYKLGTRSMKFKALPCPGSDINDTVPSKKNATPNYLRERLVATLGKEAACYQLWAQPNMEMDKQPVENPMIAWDENKSPYIPVATITIPMQSQIDSDAHLNMCENFSFNPWHSLPDQRPVGQINRMRAQIYPAISEFRHATNHVPVLEPTSFDVCNDKTTAPLCQTPQQ